MAPGIHGGKNIRRPRLPIFSPRFGGYFLGLTSLRPSIRIKAAAANTAVGLKPSLGMKEVFCLQAYFEISRDHENTYAIMPRHDNFCPPHFHSNIEVVYVEDGELEVTINKQTRRMTRGYASIANSYDVHTYQTIGHSDTRILIIPVDLVSRFERTMQSKCFSSAFLTPGPCTDEISRIIDRLEERPLPPGSLVTLGYLYTILGLFTENLELVPMRFDTGTTSLIRHILFYLERHYLEPVTLDDLAKACGYNKCYISRLFNTTLGCGFNRYVNILRVRHAAQLIRTTDDSLEEIAYQSGFQNVRNLNRYFQIFYSTTPMQYKKAL